MRDDFVARIQNSPVVAAINDTNQLGEAIEAPPEIIFLLRGSIFELKDTVRRIHAAGKQVFVHFDLMEGYSRDMTALRHLQQTVGPDGVITTKGSLIKSARELGMNSIQRVFMIDSLSVESAIKSITATRPDAIELMPGLVPRVIAQVGRETRIPVIAGGLIESKEEIIATLKAGAVGISTSKADLWYM
ncbi:MAG: glycerol-3-phosphate responsive antiterminator [Firmicutes bacterium]|nr:glycerol-3-phosphate responsive antiterminator [Bacillota bacterium]